MKNLKHQFLLIVSLSILLTISANAATYTVNTTADPGDGTCDVAECTLREAMTAANGNPGSDTIEFSATGTIDLGGVLPDITDAIIINGPGADLITVRRDTGGDYRIFTVLDSNARFFGMTVSNGIAANAGGGIYFFSQQRIHEISVGSCVISGNISNGTTGSLSLLGAQAGGGGIAAVGTIYIFDSTINGNLATGAGGGGIGAIGSLTVANSTISGNSATDPTNGDGGGIYLSGGGVVGNTTISGNSAFGSAATIVRTGGGGGIYALASGLNVTQSTITENNATFSGGGIKASDRLGSGSRALLQSTIVVSNTGSDISERVLSSSFNAVGIVEPGSDFDPTDWDLTGVTAGQINLGPLEDNGGLTKTHALLSGSVAIDKGVIESPFYGDQRGFPRSFDDPTIPNATNGDGSDIGAYEYVPYIETFRFNSATYSVDEEDGFVTITVERIGPALTSSSVFYDVFVEESTANFVNSACSPGNGGDYVFVSNVLTFAVGETSHTFDVPICSDQNVEPDETVVLRLGSRFPMVIGEPGITVLTIKDTRALPDNYSTDEDVPLIVNSLGVLANDVTQFGPLSASLVSGPAHAESFSLNANGSFNYTPDLNFHGTDSFTYRLSDSVFDHNTTTVTITVNPVNDAPVAGNDLYVIDEDTFLFGGLLSNDTDPESPVNAAGLVSNPTHAASFVFNTNGTFNYTPNPNFSGTDSFTYQAFDGNSYSNIATATIMVNPINDAPTIGVEQSDLSNVQYSDAIEPFTITGTDLETPESALTLSFSYSKDGGPQVDGLPAGLIVTDGGVVNGERVWTVSGTALVARGEYTLTPRVSDSGDGSPAPLEASDLLYLSVLPEDATATPFIGTTREMAASTPGGTATGTTGPICFDITETADGSPGDTSLINSVSLFASDDLIPFITSAQYLNFSGGEGGIGQPRTICFTLTLANAPIGSYQVGIQVDDEHYTSPQAMHAFSIVEPKADLLVGLGVSNLNPRQGDLITYTVTVRNFGPNNALNVVVNDVLSSGSTFHSARANRGTFTAPVTGQTGTVTWYLGDLTNAGQESAQIDVTVIVKGPTTIINSASVSSLVFDPNSANNAASITTSIAGKGGGGGKKN